MDHNLEFQGPSEKLLVGDFQVFFLGSLNIHCICYQKSRIVIVDSEFGVPNSQAQMVPTTFFLVMKSVGQSDCLIENKV